MAVDSSAYFKVIGYKPHKRQLEYHNSTARFTVPVCGRRFGKSTMAGRRVQPQLLEEKKRFWIVGPTYDLGEKEFRVIWEDMMIKQGLSKNKRIKRSYNKNQGDMYIEFPWQTRIEVRTADNPEHLVGESLDGVIMSEAAKHKPDTFERYIRAALSDRRGWADFPTTPEGQNWLYDIWKLGQSHETDFKDYQSWRFPSWENPYLYPGGRLDPEIVLLERTMAKDWFEQEIAADFTAYVGKIYADFHEDTHVRSHTYNPSWPNYMAFDFGYVNPLAAIEFQISPWDTIHVWREHYMSYLTLDEHIYRIKDREQPDGYTITTAFGDAADPEAAVVISQKLAPCIADPDAKTSWRDGVDLVNQFLKMQVKEVDDETGDILEEPKFFVDPSCINTIREFNNYKAPTPTGGRNKRSPRETGQAIDDHALDAIRYALMSIYKLGVQHHLDEVLESPLALPTLVNDGSMHKLDSFLGRIYEEDRGFFTTARDLS